MSEGFLLTLADQCKHGLGSVTVPHLHLPMRFYGFCSGGPPDVGKMLGGEEDKDPEAEKEKEEERQEALRQQEEERKAKYSKMEAEREVMRQGIRDKVRPSTNTPKPVQPFRTQAGRFLAKRLIVHAPELLRVAFFAVRSQEEGGSRGRGSGGHGRGQRGEPYASQEGGAVRLRRRRRGRGEHHGHGDEVPAGPSAGHAEEVARHRPGNTRLYVLLLLLLLLLLISILLQR